MSPRGRSSLRAFGLLGLSLALGVAAGLLADLVWPAVLLGFLAFAAFVASPALMWMRLLKGGRLIEEATFAWQRANAFPGSPGLELAAPACHYVLREVFRADFRARAFHLLGLLAEQRGDFAEADDLFARADAALPSMAAPRRKREVRILVAAHRALAAVALGRTREARALLERGSADLAMAGSTGLLDALDDSAWGFGNVSINEVLTKIEARRDPRAILGLAWALLHVAEGRPQLTLQLVQGERPVLEQGLLPRERALLDRLQAMAMTSLGPGPHRSPGLAVRASDPWVDAVLASTMRPFTT